MKGASVKLNYAGETESLAGRETNVPSRYLPTTVAMIRMPRSMEVTHMMTMEDQLEVIPDVPFDDTKESLRWYRLVSFSIASSHDDRCELGQSVA